MLADAGVSYLYLPGDRVNVFGRTNRRVEKLPFWDYETGPDGNSMSSAVVCNYVSPRDRSGCYVVRSSDDILWNVSPDRMEDSGAKNVHGIDGDAARAMEILRYEAESVLGTSLAKKVCRDAFPLEVS